MIRQGGTSTPGNHPRSKGLLTAGYLVDEFPVPVRGLLIAGRGTTRQLLSSTFEQDSAVRIELTTVRGMSGGLQLLRELVFDIVLAAYEPGGLDTLESLSAIKTGSHDQQAVLVLGDVLPCELDAECVECGADGYVCLRSTSVRALWCQIVRAVERQRLLRENHRLRQQLQLQRSQDKDQIQRVLDAQRQLVGNRPGRVTDALLRRYQPILQAYLMLNGPGLEQEIASLVHELQGAGYTGRDYLDLHSQVVEKLVADLAGRGARHILHRSGILALDFLLRLSSDTA